MEPTLKIPAAKKYCNLNSPQSPVKVFRNELSESSIETFIIILTLATQTPFSNNSKTFINCSENDVPSKSNLLLDKL